MSANPQKIALFGSTGSIGRSALDVLAAAPADFQLVAISAHSRLAEVVEVAHQFRPQWLIASDPQVAEGFDRSQLPPETKLAIGPEALERIAASEEVDTVIAAIVGVAGLRSTWAAIEAGKRIALANKETLVVAGPLVGQRAAETGATLLPVDSEHSAIFQVLAAGRREDVRRVILTASGGPFRDYTTDQMATVTVAQALAHPVWDMGPKITIDSATMMNKALEIIEARWLFDLAPEQIEVVIHPQSIVHSMVEFEDGSIVAQMSLPDMRLPIQYALTYPQRKPCVCPRISFDETRRLDFEPPDLDRFPAIRLGLEVAAAGGTTGAVVNAANEAAVQRFTDGDLAFTEIVTICRAVLNHHHFESSPTLDRLLELDQWARGEVTKWVCT